MALSMHIQKHMRKKTCINSKSCHFAKLFETQFSHAFVQCVYIVKTKYNVSPLKAAGAFDLPMKTLSTQSDIRGKFLSFDSCHFVKNYFESNFFIQMFNVSAL